MRSLFRFLTRYHVFLLFVFLEIVSGIFIFNNNNYHKVKFLNSSNSVTASTYNSFDKIIDYFRLGRINKELAKENARLLNQVYLLQQNSSEMDSINLWANLNKNEFLFTSARVINNTVNKQHNFITINKGKSDYIFPDQGIISNNRVVGVVSNASDSYSIGITLLNKRLNISAKIKRNNYFGPISWDGLDYTSVHLNEIPSHVRLEKGDTIVTSGFSSYFPEGILIGTIESFEKEDGDIFYSVRVDLAVDFKSISFVDIIDYQYKEEIESLENTLQDGKDLE